MLQHGLNLSLAGSLKPPRSTITDPRAGVRPVKTLGVQGTRAST